MSKQKQVGRWLSFPIFFVLLLAFFHPERSASIFPKLAPFSETSHGTSSAAKAVQDVWINGVDDAIQVGIEYSKGLQSDCFSQNSSNPTVCQEVFDRLRVLTGIEANSPADFGNLTSLRTRDASQSAIQRAAGFISFTNVLFLVGGSIVLFALVPVAAIIVGLFGPLLTRIVLFILSLLAPFYEPLAYFTAFMIIQQAQHYHSAVGWTVAFFGCLISMAAFFYSTSLHVSSSGGHKDAFLTIFGTYLALVFGIVASRHESSALGFFACVGVFTALGFSVVPFGLGFSVGFKDDEVMEQCAATSFLLLFVTIIVSNFFPSEYKVWLAPFRFGLFTMGGTTYFLATLIMASGFYKRGMWGLRQIMFLVPLFCFFSVGLVFNMPALVNTAGVFGFLYGMEKYSEIVHRNQELAWVWLLIGGSALCYTGFFLQTHPDVVISIFHAHEVI